MLFFDRNILLPLCAAFIYNLGINSHLLIFFATFNRKRIDMNEGIFSMQGKGAPQFLGIFALLLLPLAIYLPYAVNGDLAGGLLGVFLVGLTGIILTPLIHKGIHRWLIRRRYRIAASMRLLE
jgi:hypothetical protein